MTKCVSDYQDHRGKMLTDQYTSTTTAGKVKVDLANQSSFKYITYEAHMLVVVTD